MAENAAVVAVVVAVSSFDVVVLLCLVFIL